MFYASTAEEVEALRRAAARVGCRVELVRAREGVGGLEASIVCGDGWTAARLLLALAAEDARTPGARALAASLRSVAPSPAAYARAVQAFVRDRVEFRPEVGEVFQSGAFTLRQGFGDCDDHFRLAYALAVAGGLPAGLGLLYNGGRMGAAGWPSHAAPLFDDGRGWAWAETTIAARYGEAPMVAASRLGVVSARRDLAKGVRVMTESDLPPVPAGFDDRNGCVEVAADALRRLGWLGEDACVHAASDLALRLAVRDFQRARGLVPDGLLGPVTRRELAAAMVEAGAPILEGVALDELAAAPRPARRLTAHLSDRFFAEVLAMAARFRAEGAAIDASDLLAVWLAESGIRPDAANGAGAPFYGLNQLGLPMHARAVGWLGTAADYLGLDAADQLPYVERYYQTTAAISRFRDAGSLYLANFLPAFMAHAGDPSFVLARRSPDDDGSRAFMLAHRSDWYAWNRSLDIDGDGAIQVRDMAAAVERAKAKGGAYWAEVVDRLADVERNGPGPDPVSGAAVVGGLVLAVGALGGAAAAALRVLA